MKKLILFVLNADGLHRLEMEVIKEMPKVVKIKRRPDTAAHLSGYPHRELIRKVDFGEVDSTLRGGFPVYVYSTEEKEEQAKAMLMHKASKVAEGLEERVKEIRNIISAAMEEELKR
jgi:hypothetical protein